MLDGLEAVLEEEGLDEEGWEAVGEDALRCPDGFVIELDGTCPMGCESPLLELGVI
jgi:hypothetical protein